ncbi:MAG TPA: HipA family kinase [Terriglobales bacterium]|nr:HipA family kinase [Terriglobales bacterium]
MRGGAQGHLMRVSDGNYYVVKFQNNPQHIRVLANDLLATRLGLQIGLPMAAAEVIEVGEWLIEHTPELAIEIAGKRIPCQPGLQFGSRYIVDPAQGQVLDYLPESFLWGIRNLGDFAGILAFDKWTCNADGRQAVYWRRSDKPGYSAAFIDQGYCFNDGEWAFRDSPLRGAHSSNQVYTAVTGWESFEPWLSAIEALNSSAIGGIASAVPPEWYDADWDALEKLVDALARRCRGVRELITEFRRSSRQPFPNWKNN